jgi:hypothetical protein
MLVVSIIKAMIIPVALENAVIRTMIGHIQAAIAVQAARAVIQSIQNRKKMTEAAGWNVLKPETIDVSSVITILTVSKRMARTGLAAMVYVMIVLQVTARAGRMDVVGG